MLPGGSPRNGVAMQYDAQIWLQWSGISLNRDHEHLLRDSIDIVAVG
jgi:hypothetical protein